MLAESGGSGERFWPMSRRKTPKHLLRLLGERTLLEATISRLEGVVPRERTFVLTHAAQVDGTRASLPMIFPSHIIAEPTNRDTAPACALATAIARVSAPDALCIVLPADAMIHDVAGFQRQLRDAIVVASRDRLPGYLAEHFASLPKISVDYAIMERAGSIAAVLAEFDWDDVGAWTALPSHLGLDPDRNSLRRQVVQNASGGNIAISNGRLIALCGVHDRQVFSHQRILTPCAFPARFSSEQLPSI